MYKYLLIIISSIFLSCTSTEKSNKSYVKEENAKYHVYELPKKLTEISGFIFLTDSLIATIEDEHGTLYYYDLAKEKIIKEYSFAEDGDYEDITRVNKDIYIVKSDGTIYQIKDFASEHPAVVHYKTPLKQKNDIEGLAYDKINDRLLLSVKEKNLEETGKVEETKNIYQFSLKDKKLIEEPLFSIHLKDVENTFKGDELLEASKKMLKAIGNKNLNDLVKPSAITYNPINGNLYILSSINKLIVMLDKEGKFLKVVSFKGKEFIQPEGIAFNSKGDMYISNEGKNKKGNIIKMLNIDAK